MLLSLASAGLLALLLTVALWNLVAAPRLEGAGSPHDLPRVSVLVPARNEAENLRATLPALLRLDYPALEILVLDDGSEDGTAAEVEGQIEEAAGRLRLLRGQPLPEGWLGKSWACHQLAEVATGEVLLFCDADVTVRPAAVERTVAAMQEAGADALTAMPRQRWGSWAEHAIVPLVAQLPVLALLPLPLVPGTRAPSLAMGNGQWLAFSREAYRGCGGHAAVRAELVEDVALARRVKAAGHRLVATVAPSLLEVRMYRGGTEVRHGFGKNLYPLLGGRPAALSGGLLVFFLAAVYPWAAVLMGAPAAFLPFTLLLALRLCGALLFRHGPATVLLHPLGSLAVVGLALESFARLRRGAVRWKGREVNG